MQLPEFAGIDRRVVVVVLPENAVQFTAEAPPLHRIRDAELAARCAPIRGPAPRRRSGRWA